MVFFMSIVILKRDKCPDEAESNNMYKVQIRLN